MGNSHLGPHNDLGAGFGAESSAGSITAAAIHLRRGNFSAALNQCKAILEADPENLDARELLGEVLAAQGLWDAAIAEFKRVLDAEPNRPSAERKLAEATLGRAGLKDLAFATDSDTTPRKPGTAAILSLVFPGLGQIYNHQLVKGFITFASELTLIVFILWGLLLAPMQVDGGAYTGNQGAALHTTTQWAEGLANMSILLKLLLVAACAAWLCIHMWSIFDAAFAARRHVQTPLGR